MTTLEPLDVEAVRADDALIEDLRAGAIPPAGDELTQLLTAWRDDCRGRSAPNPRT